MRVDHASPTPVYRQLSEWIVERISTGEWPEGHQLPAEPTLAAGLGVSRGTLRKTISLLVQRGLLEQVHGKGTFVARSLIEQPLASSLTSVSEEFIRSGTSFTTLVRDQQMVPADQRAARALGRPQGTGVIHLERVRAVDSTPVIFNESFLPADRFSALLDVDFRVERLFSALEERCGVVLQRARRTISAITASPNVAKALDVQLGSPILYSEQTVFDTAGLPVEYSRAWFRGDRFRLSSETVRYEGDPVHAVAFPTDWAMEAEKQ
jgi:GntR family transcriptional regulator